MRTSASLPRLVLDNEKRQLERQSLWRESALVLQRHSDKLPFLFPPPANGSSRPYAEDELSKTSPERHHLSPAVHVAAAGGRRCRRTAMQAVPPTDDCGGGALPALGDSTAVAAVVASRVAASVACKRGGRGPIKTKIGSSVPPMTRKENQQAALASDRRFVQSQLAQGVESGRDREAREQIIDNHWWEAMFAPVPRPRDFLHSVFSGNLPLPLERGCLDPRHAIVPGTGPPSLTHEESDQVLRVCKAFNALVTPTTPQSDSGIAVLGRPSFCRLICALGGLSLTKWGTTRLLRAVVHFDRLAENIPVNGCSCPGGSIFGIALLPFYELPLHILWGYMVQDLADDMPERQSFDDRVAGAKAQLFGLLVPKAEQYAEQRMAFVCQQMQCGGPPPAQALKPPLGSKKDAAGNGRVGCRWDGPPTSEGMTSSTAVARNCDSSCASEVDEDNLEESWACGASASLYVHTFAVLKGELLASQLLEPEVMHFVVEFGSLFHVLFCEYCDVPLNEGPEGHMTVTAFLRFCSDFGLFPRMVDFQTVQWLYDTADEFGRKDRAIDALLATCCAREGRVDSPSATGMAGPSTTMRGHGRKRLSSLLPPQQVQRPGEPPPIVWSGKWCVGTLAWLTKDADTWTEDESACAALLGAVGEWMSDRQLRPQTLFAALDINGNGCVSVSEILIGVEFMSLENPPSPEEVQRAIALLVPPGVEEIDFRTLEAALMIANRQREKLEQAANCFLKDYADMTPQEYNACIFFKELLSTLEKNHFTPKQLFLHFDANHNGALESEELTKHTKAYLQVHRSWSSKLQSIEKPFALLDLNEDGYITLNEFCCVFEQVRAARERQRVADERHPLFLSTNNLLQRPEGRPRTGVFGLQAFVACLLKIGLVHMSYHGTAAQAMQPSIFKLAWLLCYMHWQFDRAGQDLPRKSAVDADAGSPRRRRARYVSPLERLWRGWPGLFRDPPPGRRRTTAPSCWGTEADGILRRCLADPHASSGPQALDLLLLSTEVGHWRE